tara:strand:- start:530 stop:910 length:381 start_codon:yes stop_codon:yes gene_type:complete
MKKIKTSHLLITTFVLVIGLLLVSSYLKESNTSNLNKNGIETFAKITKIEVNDYRANEMDWSTVENSIITFSFIINGKTIKSVRTIKKSEFKQFFNKKITVNDTISILYEAENPKNNKVKELDNLK